MDFAAMVAMVIVITKRPDKLGLITATLKQAALKAHAQDFYYKDLVELPVVFPTPAYITDFEPSLTLPRFRKPKYVRVWNYDQTSPTLGEAGVFIKWIDIENSLDAYGQNKVNVAYMAGSNIQIRTPGKLSHILFGAYVFPDVSGDAENLEETSFIAREQPNAIIYESARQVFKSIGFDEQSGEMNRLVQEEWGILAINSVNHPGE